MKKVIVISLLILFFNYSYVQATNVTAEVLKLGATSAAWSGTTRVIPMLLKAGNVAKWVVGTLNPAALALVGVSILGQYALEHPETFEKLGAWLNFNSYRINNGSYEKSTTTYGYTTGTNEYNDGQTWHSWAGSAFTGWGTIAYETYNTLAAYNVRKNALIGQGYSVRSGLPTYTYIGNDVLCLGSAPTAQLVVLDRPATDNQNVGPIVNWAPAATSEVTAKWSSDIQNVAPPVSAKNLWEEMERKISNSQAQDLVAQGSGVLTGAAVAGGGTVGDVVKAQALAGIGSTVITNIQNEGDVTNNIDGDVTSVNSGTAALIDQAKKEADGGVVAPTAPGAYSKTTGNINSVINTFWNNLKATAMFGLIANFFNYTPGEGSCTISIDMGTTFGGEKTVSFCDWNLIPLKAALLIGFAFLSIRIVFLKR